MHFKVLWIYKCLHNAFMYSQMIIILVQMLGAAFYVKNYIVKWCNLWKLKLQECKGMLVSACACSWCYVSPALTDREQYFSFHLSPFGSFHSLLSAVWIHSCVTMEMPDEVRSLGDRCGALRWRMAPSAGQSEAHLIGKIAWRTFKPKNSKAKQIQKNRIYKKII